MLPAYDIRQTYDWNYEHAPPPAVLDVPDCPGTWDFCGIPVNSPLGVPAGPLLNSGWILYYASLGFDVLTYKTVRSSYRACYGLPNLLPVRDEALPGEGGILEQARQASGSWAISFGMPSRDPAQWLADVERARLGLRQGQVLVVSVVASPDADWTIDQVAADFARCARWAADSGAHVVEANLSCPNVCTQEADLYLSPLHAAAVASAVRQAVPGLPVALKVGLFHGAEQAKEVIAAVGPYADALCATNSITARVSSNGQPLFDGLRRGIGGTAITARCLQETAMLAGLLRQSGSTMKLVSVGGVATPEDVRDRLRAGAHHVQIATAAMLDPSLALRIRKAAL